jgi:hypothetical protein
VANRDTTGDVEIVAFDQAFRRKRDVAGMRACDFGLALNATSSGTFELDADDDVNAYLQAPGARVTVSYRGKQEISGPVRKQGLGLLPTDRAVYTVEDDFRVFGNTAAWVVPVAAYSSQGKLDAQSLSDDAQAISTVAHPAGTNAGYGAFVFTVGAGGSLSAEAAIKQLVTANLVQRLGPAWKAARGTPGIPWSVSPNLDRGGDAGAAGKLPAPRFESLADNLAALLTWSGLRLVAYQDATPGTAQIVVDVVKPTTWTQTITLDSGILVDGSGSIAGPNATRVAVGGPGDVTARDWHEVLDGTGLEALWGDVIEVVKDASSAQITWPDPSVLAAQYQVPKFFRLRPEIDSATKATYLAALNTAGAEALTEGLPKSGIGVTLAETKSFHFGGDKGVTLGQNLPVQLAAAIPGQPAPVILAKVTGATIKFDEETGTVATTTVGERTDDPDLELSAALAAVQTALRRRASRK